jgi:error-prone DNA polymerase
MFYRRPELMRLNVKSARELQMCRDGEFVRGAGFVIVPQRPGTAKGFIFFSMEDETGIANVIVTPALYERQKRLMTCKVLLVEGRLQNQDGVIHVKATCLKDISGGALDSTSHDFR